MPEYCCIAGTDTDAGKTVVTAALARAALDANLSVLCIKPVQTGAFCDGRGERNAPDLLVYREAASGSRENRLAVRTLALFEPACSPHLAARMAGKRLTARELADGVRVLVREHPADLVLVEGAGGLLTPVNETETLCDVFAALGWPVLLVAANRLGAVNHALLSLAHLSGRGLACPGFVLNRTVPEGDALTETIRSDNGAIIAAQSGVPCLAELPYCKELGVDAVYGAARALEPVLRLLTKQRESPSAHRAFSPEQSRLLPDVPAQSGAAHTGASSAAALLDFDRDHLWHPYTSALHPLPCREAVATEGSRIRLRDGRDVIDGMASWWCAIHGYRHPTLMRALREQAAVMPHVMFGGLTHAPAVALARKLLAVAPPGLEHVFFADSGSVAVEVALKMALQYRAAASPGKSGARSRILTVRGGYHGDTMGAMSVCDPENGMHGLFAGMLPRQIFAPRPECRFNAPYDDASAAAFEAVLREHAGEIAAVILEPIVQGAGGMWMYHPAYLRRVRELCTEHGCLLILDEIATGFGRTGKFFACEHAGVAPDILCLGKGLTGGVMTLAATLASGEVARGISRDGGVLMHGPTFMANPLACAVAGASLDILASGTWEADVARIEHRLREGLAACVAGCEGVADVRVLGAVAAVEMDRAVNVERLQRYCIDRHGVWLRPFGKLIYMMPPYTLGADELERLCAAVAGAVREGEWR